ncbi:MAG TPA: DEAD/DEAH box helicase family protein [Solirubrobacteraceae bacterium]|nr:DEAD/DEAH box helicase family protein [Solirubrobacteraceae bacterium]
MTATALPGLFDELSFGGEWRRYQKAAIAAFESDRANGHRRTHIVAPPGSGKTLVGVELVRRLGRRALVLTPNSAVQMQWPRAIRRFGSPSDVSRTAGPEPAYPIACMTYQSLCQLEDPEVALGRLATLRWAEQRATATGEDVEAIQRERYDGAAAERRAKEMARISAGIKREIARGDHAGVELMDLLSATVKTRLSALQAGRVGVVVLDECHHLASMWGYVVRAVLDALGTEDVHVIGLTATPPSDLTGEEAELYAELLGPVDFTVPTPAVVRDGHLAPYQELAWLTEPLSSERAWLAEHDTRFKELVTALHEDVESPHSFPAWVITRLRERRRSADDEAQVPWEEFQRARPRLARAGVRFLASAGLDLPEGAPRGEAYRRAPDLEDWLTLLEDYALRCLHPAPEDEAAERYAAIAAALAELGFRLTRQGIRRGTSEVDRLLTSSQAKALGLVEVLASEMESRGDTLRALVLCDAELAEAKPDRLLAGVLDPASGTARQALMAVGADARTAPLRPLVVSGRGLRCLPADADVLLAALVEQASEHLSLPDWEAVPDGVLISLRSSGAEWVPRAWVDLATRVLESGVAGALIGTRALLGEGWDCPAVNCLVDMTVAATGVSVQQMRGRSLRLDPDDPEKLASNWDVVCVAPDLVRGSADYERFVRKHLHLYAPADDGEIEAGPSHVHAELSPFAPPPAARFAELNRAMVARAADRDEARERWRIGEEYRGADLRTLVVRQRGSDPSPDSAPQRDAYAVRGSDPPHISQRLQVGLAGAGLVAAVAATVVLGVVGLAGLAVTALALGWAAFRLRTARERLPLVLPLDRAARAVIDAYHDLGELSDAAAGSLEIEPRASGYLRILLTGATPEESDRFASALDELAGTSDAPRYLVTRPLPDPDAGAATLLGRVLARKPPFPSRHHPVPADLARRKERAEAFARAWQRHLGPGTLVFTQRSDEGRRARAEAAADDGGYETLVRDVWV